MFGRKQQPKDAVDVNDFIVSDSMQAGIHIDADLGSPVPSVDISDDQIIDADYSEPPTRKRLKTSQVLILGAVAVFAVGGVASIFVSPQTPEQNPVVAASEQPQVVAAPEPAAKLPPGLADPDQVQPPATIPGPSANGSGNGTPSATDSLVSAPATATVPTALAIPTAPSPTPATAPVVASAAAASPQAPIAAPVPQVADTKAPLPPAASPAANPVTAQIAEAQKLSPVTQPAPVAQPKASPAVAQTQAAPKPQQAIAPVPPAPKVAPATANHPIVEKKAVAVTPAATKPVTPAQPKQVATERENSEEGIKRLVTTSAEAFGVQSIQEGAITLEGRRGNAPQRLHVGDRLPSGEQILRIDARSMTLVTDRSVIRLN